MQRHVCARKSKKIISVRTEMKFVIQRLCQEKVCVIKNIKLHIVTDIKVRPNSFFEFSDFDIWVGGRVLLHTKEITPIVMCSNYGIT